MRQYIVDAFTNKVFRGNPAAVCVMDKWPEEKLMMKIAEESAMEEAFGVRPIKAVLGLDLVCVFENETHHTRRSSVWLGSLPNCRLLGNGHSSLRKVLLVFHNLIQCTQV